MKKIKETNMNYKNVLVKDLPAEIQIKILKQAVENGIDLNKLVHMTIKAVMDTYDDLDYPCYFTKTLYETSDGSRFSSEVDAEEYEMSLKRAETLAELDSVELIGLRGLPPMDNGYGYVTSDVDEKYKYSEYRWYQIKTEEDADKIYKLFNELNTYCDLVDTNGDKAVIKYPDIICIQIVDGDIDYYIDASCEVRVYQYEEIMNNIKDFCKKVDDEKYLRNIVLKREEE